MVVTCGLCAVSIITRLTRRKVRQFVRRCVRCDRGDLVPGLLHRGVSIGPVPDLVLGVEAVDGRQPGEGDDVVLHIAHSQVAGRVREDGGEARVGLRLKAVAHGVHLEDGGSLENIE